MQTETTASDALIRLRLMNLATMADIYREQGDVKQAEALEVEAYELLKSLRLGIQ